MRGLLAWSAWTALLLGLAAATAWAAATGQPPVPSAPSRPDLAALPAAPARDACRTQRGAFLSARLRGASKLDVNWHGAALSCDGGVRPDGRGMRVSFSGQDHAHRVLFIFGIDSAPRAGDTHNVPTNVTVIFEGERRLYSTRGNDRCMIDELSARSLPMQDGLRRLALRARGFCIAPASALGSGAPLLVSRFDFNGAIFRDDADRASAAPGGGAHRNTQTPAH
jgi:hypothetical protein